MNLPTARHRLQAELDELIAMTNERRGPSDARVASRAQLYAHVDDEFDAARAVASQRQVPTRCPRCGVVGNGLCCAGL